MKEMAKQVGRKILSRPKVLAGCLLLLMLIVVILQNLEAVTLDFLFWNLGPFAKLWLILGSMAVGAGLAEGIRLLLKNR
jgi:uncharacterized integral membrane protein